MQLYCHGKQTAGVADVQSSGPYAFCKATLQKFKRERLAASLGRDHQGLLYEKTFQYEFFE